MTHYHPLRRFSLRYPNLVPSSMSVTCLFWSIAALSIWAVVGVWTENGSINQHAVVIQPVDTIDQEEVTEELGPNLLANSSFEEVSASESGEVTPIGWIKSIWSGNPTFSVESTLGKSGNNCVKIHSDDGADASWSFRVDVERNSQYQLSAWIKTSEVAGGGFGALLNLHELQMEGKANALRGNHDWKLVTTRFDSGNRETLLVNLLFGGWGRATGTAWFDDIQLCQVKLPSPPVLSTEEASVLFETRVLPILEENCFSCHGSGEKIRAELVLRNRADLRKGGESGEVIDLESPADSLLLEAINFESYEMPPSGKLAPEEIDAITQWVLAGAPWRGKEIKPKRDADVHSTVPQVNEETKQWWSFQPVQRPDIPGSGDGWALNDIDRFVIANLESQGLQPAFQADRQTLVRRAYYDLLGLPPSPEQVRRFVEDDSPDAWSSLIEELLASPHYGEKWGRHWLDVVRYGESNSYERDGTKPFVWRYRDYVIRSFNDDKPYDMFLMEQLAGDEMDHVTPERIIATGYYRLGLWDDEPADPEQAWYDDMDDILATTSQAMLGMTINCARCHDHKIDPVPQEDYYRLLAFFRNVRRYGVRSHQTVEAASVRVIAPPEARDRFHAEMEAWHHATNSNRDSMEAIENIVKPDFIPVEHEDFKNEMNRVQLVQKRAEGDKPLITKEQSERYQELFAEMKRLRSSRPAALEAALCVKEKGTQPDKTHLLVRGNAHAPGKEVQPGFPSVLSPPTPEITPPKEGKSTGRRMALARWIVDPANPLTSRVMVNRIWQHHFGRGIVRSASDFGFQGTLPTHPKLLDWLAAEFIAEDWSVKSMHRLMMNSATYQMASDFNEASYAVDPLNDHMWRFDMRRLTAEEVRDSILAVNGSLNRDKFFGPSIYPVIPDEVLQGQSVPGANWGNSSAADLARRSIYIHIKRSLPVPLLASFDAADPDTPCPVRFNTVQPTQALAMINSDFLKKQSLVFAEALFKEFPQQTPMQVKSALQRVLQRQPLANEIQRGVDFVNLVNLDDDIDDLEALRQFCLIALNLNEFLFLD